MLSPAYSSNRSNRTWAVALFVVGGAFFLASPIILLGNLTFLRHSHAVIARIIQVEVKSGRYTSYIATVKFADLHGVEHTAVAPSTSTRPGGIGDQIQILNNTEDPDVVRTDSASNLVVVPIGFGVFALVMVGGGIYLRKLANRPSLQIEN
jgi:hypothetical protein